MKLIRYTYNNCEKSFAWSEYGEEIAKREAFNGEYEIFDDGKEEQLPKATHKYLTWKHAEEFIDKV